MRKLLPILSLVLIANAANAANPDRGLYVEVNSTKLREKPQFWAKGLKDLHYGDKLASAEQENSWFKTKDANGLEGYVHASAVTKKKIILSSKSNSAAAKPDETDVVLAGKGFNREVEGAYASAGGEVNYKAVDQMQKIRIDDVALYSFLQNGKLRVE